MVSVSFTGTRKGMSPLQEALIMNILKSEDFTEHHHGDCEGADKQFHNLIVDRFKGIRGGLSNLIFIHPPDNDKYRAFCKEGLALPEKPYLERNKDIVDSSPLLIATPHKDDEINKQRSGTWSTIRYAKKQKKDIIIII